MKSIQVAQSTHSKMKHISIDLGVSMAMLTQLMLDAFKEKELLKSDSKKVA